MLSEAKGIANKRHYKRLSIYINNPRMTMMTIEILWFMFIILVFFGILPLIK